MVKDNDVKLTLKDGKEVYTQKGTEMYQVIKENNIDEKFPAVLAKLNGKYYELNSKINESGNFEAVDITSRPGNIVYVRTLQFVLTKAVHDIFPHAVVTIEHTISSGLYGEIHKKEKLNIDDIPLVKKRMEEIIKRDIPIRKLSVKKEEALKIFADYGMDDKVRLLETISNDRLKLYELDGVYDYFYGPMAYSTGALSLFELNYYDNGFLLRIPKESDPLNIPHFYEQKKLENIFYETEKWGNILNVPDVGSLNKIVESGHAVDLIRVAEALHEKKTANIADMISSREKIKIVLVAGPSSSGKTTFAKRLAIQLRVNGLIPIPISLDDYFLSRDKTPKDENGQYDFESINALDLELFNKNLTDLLSGKEVEIPVFDFKKGEREWVGNKVKMPVNGVLIIEGIHGLNETLTSSIPRENKFKIYISALTQLNLDNHNRIPTTDLRIIRRIVRDFLSRGYGGEETLKMLPSIKKGEERNIFVFQEEGDVMFNSSLIYELCVLKKYALSELSKIGEDSPVYHEALRLRSFLHFFKEIDADIVPENSLLREFIGGSCFYKY